MSGDRVFLGGISRDATNEDVDALVRKIAEPREIHHTGKGFSFVQFSSAEEAQAFVDKIQGEELCGMRLRPEISKPKTGSRIPDEKWNAMTPRERDEARAARSGGGGGGGQRGAFIPADQWNAMTPRERDEARAARGGGRDNRRDSPPRRRRDDSRGRRDSRSPRRRKDSRSPRRDRRRSRS